MFIEGGVEDFPSCLTSESLRIIFVWETPKEISLLPLNNTLRVHYFEVILFYRYDNMVYYKLLVVHCKVPLFAKIMVILL